MILLLSNQSWAAAKTHLYAERSFPRAVAKASFKTFSQSLVRN